MTHPNPPEVVTQGDREAAAHLHECIWGTEDLDAKAGHARLLNGERDGEFMVQAFARHRLRHTPDREAMARVIDPAGWDLLDINAHRASPEAVQAWKAENLGASLRKADALIAMIEGGGDAHS